ncbi:NAD(P)-dependent oxidoreductase [Streptomyces odontomachi]|uniref:NAD(P)-dependent oxidoreductase n=1 Tax=Streptomyces odontomachi TaxID=2944940 RepID=UPI00210D4D97|nr:NAD(P)-dependent oxidoreductase [Streptomyces sp. ODS25]
MTSPSLPSSPSPAVAVIGLGTMGGRAAAAFAAAGRPTAGADPFEAARTAAARQGVTVSDSPAAAVSGADLVLLSLPTPQHVLDVVDEIAGALGPGALVADTSTIDPETAQEAARRLAAHGARYVDAPVLGRPEGIGSWTLVAGGAQADVTELAAAAVGVIAKSVEQVGEVGAGSTVKVLNNVMFGAINAVTAEVVDLAERAGISAETFGSVVAGSGAATVSPLFRDISVRMAGRDYEPAFTLALLEKDVRLGAGIAARFGVQADVTTAVQALISEAVSSGRAGQDTSALVELLRAR